MTNRLLGVTKDGILRLDEKTKEIFETWPLDSINRWAATQNIFVIDVGSQGFYSVQTTDGDKISNMVEKYVVAMRKQKEGEEAVEECADSQSLDTLSSNNDPKPAVTNDEKKQVKTQFTEYF